MTTPKGRDPTFELRPPADRGSREAPDRQDLIGRLAPSRATVLLRGGSAETKARVARALHDRSPRAPHPFVAVDCAAIERGAIEEVVFGEAAYGVSTPPDKSRATQGAIADAEHGTLYIAAIDALPMGAQPRFLRFLDEPRTVRLVVSSDANLAALARRGDFRADLGERLLLVRVDLSALDTG